MERKKERRCESASKGERKERREREREKREGESIRSCNNKCIAEFVMYAQGAIAGLARYHGGQLGSGHGGVCDCC